MRYFAILVLFLIAILPAQAQTGADLSAPLLPLNQCGAGEPGAVQFTLAATGDTFPHENIQAVGEAQGYDYLFDRIRPFLQAADLAYTNFDGAMLASSPPGGYPNFNYNPALAPALRNAGIGLVSTANNHILDRGPEGIDATLQVLADAGIQQHGAVSSTQADQPRPPYLLIPLSREGVTITVGFVSATWGTNGIADPYNQVNLLYTDDSYGNQGRVRPEILDAVRQADAAADLVVVAAHWGFEYRFDPDVSQLDAARALAEAGADVILGAQAHTLQPLDWIVNGERQTLVAYSLGNFLASQGAFQAQYYSATSVVLYVGIVRHADGRVTLNGYRYLPTLMSDNDTRPAPLPEDQPAVLAHVRQMLRDPGGLRQIPGTPPTEHMEVCMPLQFAETPDLPVPGDFAQHIVTLGDGTTLRTAAEYIAVFGFPLSAVVDEPAGDCRSTTRVLYTERQRLEWHPEAPWPFRVIGSQIGVEVYRATYPASAIQRRTDLDGDAIAHPLFREFYTRYGGLHVFGYPISGLIDERREPDGQQRQVQYFERARFELVPGISEQAALLEQVQLGLLGREYPGISVQCPNLPTRPTPAPQTPTPIILAPQAGRVQPAQPVAPQPGAEQAPQPVAPRNAGIPTSSILMFIILVLTILAGFIAYATFIAQRRHRESYAARRARRHKAENHEHTNSL